MNTRHVTRLFVLALALLAALALAASDSSVTGGNANPPGSPGIGNPSAAAAPLAAGPPPGRGLGMTANTGSSGVGIAGGLGGSSGLGLTGSFPAGSTRSAPITPAGAR